MAPTTTGPMSPTSTDAGHKSAAPRESIINITGPKPDGDGSCSDFKPEKRTKKFNAPRGQKSLNTRVKLPTIESYEKELEFQADAPGRVVVRLERLMGTDRIRITDPKYMALLLRRLEEEEQTLWVKRSKDRKKKERDRYRQLAIDGLMEPGHDMMYLYHHPVFRVNRILKRLSKLDNSMSTTAAKKIPPIVQVEPFDELEKTGLLFGFHKNHYMKTKESYESNMANFTPVETAEPSMASFRPPRFNENGVLIMDKSYMSPQEAEDDFEEWGGEDYPYVSSAENYEEKEQVPYHDLLQNDSMTLAKMHYGIKAEEDLEATWALQRSNLIDQLYAEEMEDAAKMMEFSKEVLGTYKREQLVADNFIQKVHRKLFL